MYDDEPRIYLEVPEADEVEGERISVDENPPLIHRDSLVLRYSQKSHESAIKLASSSKAL